MAEQVMIVVGAPVEYGDKLLDAISSAGGGIIGEYTHCGFTSLGYGRFKPSESANPHIGDKEAINKQEEIRVESFCDRAVARAVVDAIREAHPYEEPVIYVIPLLDLDTL